MNDALPIASGAQTWAALAARAKGRRRWFVAALACFLAGAALDLVVPYATGHLVDLVRAATQGGPAPTGAAVVVPAVAMVAATLLSAGAGGLGEALAPSFFSAVLARLREDMMGHALRLPQVTLERAGSADLVSRAGEDVARAKDAVNFVIPRFISVALTLVVSGVGLLALHPAFALPVLIGAVCYGAAVRWFGPRAGQAYVAERAASARRAHHILAGLHARETVDAFGLARDRVALVGRGSWEVVHRALHARRLVNTFVCLLILSEFVVLVATVATAYALVAAGSIQVGAAGAALLIVTRVFGPVRFVLMFLDDAYAATTAVRRIVGVFQAPAAQDAPAPGRSSAAVSVEHVSFAYGDHDVLHDVTLALAPGERVALVGASGAGKTTLAALVAGLLPPRCGRVTWGAGTRHVALVAQEVHTFSGTLREDVALALPPHVAPESPEALEVVADAVARVGASEWVNALPDGLDTVVGRLGLQPTPAQAQQLALARLLVADPDVVVLDEATAEAGSSGARVLDDAAREVAAGRTALIVAHRLSQAATADRVLVMEDGRIVEDGTPAELIAAGGRYAHLWNAWEYAR